MALLGLINVVGPRERHDGFEIDQCRGLGGGNEGVGGEAAKWLWSFGRAAEGGTKQRPHCIGGRAEVGRDEGGREGISTKEMRRRRRAERSDYNMAS